MEGRIAPFAKLDGFFAGTASTIGGWRYVQYDGIVAGAADEHFGRGRGVISMMIALLVAGIGLLLAGLVAIGFGIPINEFGLGNTLILAGTVAACSGVLLLGLWVVVAEIRNIVRRLGSGMPAESLESAGIPGPASRHAAPENGGFLFSHDQPVGDDAGRHPEPAPQPPGSSPPPWLEGTAPAVKPRRNLLFSSSSRKERERAQARTAEPSVADLHPPMAAAPESAEAPPANFDDAWPKSERASAAEAPLPRRGGRAPSTFTEAGGGADRHPLAARNEDQPPVTVLKSGVVDGMAYSLYSDGSIEAQMPEGMMRFASIDELRAHLDHRP